MEGLGGDYEMVWVRSQSWSWRGVGGCKRGDEGLTFATTLGVGTRSLGSVGMGVTVGSTLGDSTQMGFAVALFRICAS